MENAIYHGIKYKPEKGHIRITGRREQNAIVIQIMDDGAGMDAEKASTILTQHQPSERGSGVGVANVNHRLQLYVGYNYGLEFASEWKKEGSVQKAYDLTSKLLRSDPGISGIIALNEPSTVGAGKAIQDLGLKDKVKLVGFDNSNEEIQLIDDGVLLATVIQKPFNMGYLAVKTAVDILQGRKVDPVIDTGSKLITKSNMYTKENEKLLFPFIEDKVKTPE